VVAPVIVVLDEARDLGFITVTWRRSAASCGATGAAGELMDFAASSSTRFRSTIARSSLRRWPSDVTPIFSRS
jgi:hypothetical protein